MEVKRSSDTRLRREVVGQMLDYAANAVAYWPVERIQQAFEARCAANQEDPEQLLLELTGDEEGLERFWSSVKTNLQAGKIRMVFVADVIPTELRRVVEFLNEQMNPAEVLAVEVKQFVGEGIETFVPRVVGQTAAAQQKRATSLRDAPRWDEARFFETLAATNPPEVVRVARALLDWARDRQLRLWWGQGKTTGSFFPFYDGAKGTHWTFSVWTSAGVEIQFQHMASRQLFGPKERRAALLERLNRISGVTIGEDRLEKRPAIPLKPLTTPTALTQFLEVFDWYLQELKAFDAEHPDEGITTRQ